MKDWFILSIYIDNLYWYISDNSVFIFSFKNFMRTKYLSTLILGHQGDNNNYNI